MKREDIEIKQIAFNYPPYFAEYRYIDVLLTTGNVIIIESDNYDSWIQYGGTPDELKMTAPIAEKYNDWLHGED